MESAASLLLLRDVSGCHLSESTGLAACYPRGGRWQWLPSIAGQIDCSITFRVPLLKTSSTEGSNNLTFDYSKRIRRQSEHIISASPICPLEEGDNHPSHGDR